MNIEIRREDQEDAEAIHTVTALAFGDAPHAAHTEQFIVRALRESGALTLSLVAEHEGQIIGHVAVSPVTVTDASKDWYGLGPISVLPEFQGQMVGSRLMRQALVELEDRGAAGCVLLGDPGYYSRFGFDVVAGLVLPGVPPEYFQAISFCGVFAEGEVSYHRAFSATA